jgi:three-Cys-motif partner protein
MAWDEQFFIQPRLTSKLKHLVLRAYMKEFAYHLGSVRPVVYYVDGFAGAGAYGHDTRTEDGSPLLIARLAQEISTYSRPIDLRCLNVESDLKRFRSLEEATEPFRPGIVEKNYHGSFAELIPEILSRIGSAPTFFFIDPFGTKDIAFADLLPIFNRERRTEVLITLHTDGIAKKAGYFAREDATARKLTAHLAAALGVSLERLRQVWSETGKLKDTTQFENRALAYYLRRLRSNATRFAFTKAFKVLYYRRDTFAEPPVCFHLVFATQHQEGLFEMNDVMVEALDTFYRDVYGGSFIPTFEAERKRQEDPTAVRREMEADFSGTPFTVNELKCHCMQQTDYLLKSGEYTKIVRDMVRSGALQKLDSGPLSNSKTRYRIVNRS